MFGDTSYSRHLSRSALNILAIVVQIGVSHLHAQNQSLKFEHLGMREGLSQSSVYCILQDHQGFMWFGTQAGLNKYDGYNFTVYRHNVFDSTSLSQDVAWAICEDHTGALWAGGSHAACLNRFERETERFTRFVHNPNDPINISIPWDSGFCY